MKNFRYHAFIIGFLTFSAACYADLSLNDPLFEKKASISNTVPIYSPQLKTNVPLADQLNSTTSEKGQIAEKASQIFNFVKLYPDKTAAVIGAAIGGYLGSKCPYIEITGEIKGKNDFQGEFTVKYDKKNNSLKREGSIYIHNSENIHYGELKITLNKNGYTALGALMGGAAGWLGFKAAQKVYNAGAATYTLAHNAYSKGRAWWQGYTPMTVDAA